MDSLTHLVLGAAIGEAILGKKIGRKAMLWGAIADTIPDFDVLASPCITHAQQLMIHRGITHSFLFAIVVSFLLGRLFYQLSTNTNVSKKDWTLLFFLGMFTHDIIDAMTCYGTGWFEPFSSYRVSFNNIFVADPFYTLPFLICVLVALIAKNGSATRVKWNKAGLIISTFYLAFTIINKGHVQSIIEHSLEKQKITHYDFVTTPTPLNNFLWMSYAADSSGFWFGYYSLFDKMDTIRFYHINKNDALLKSFENDNEVKILKQFSKGDYCIAKKNDTIYFNDIRFGQVGGWNKPDSSFVFSFKLNKNADNSTALNRGKFKGTYTEALSSLINRIKGY
jgi:inner membrane protein